ncbi:MAG: hypothetical protein IJU98_12515 [Synergistaceae bacterium]|nr:hypothetical protein [Synergistaceae bacterium]
MVNSTADIMSRGMRCLMQGLGLIEAEQFISVIIREKFDYTQWQREYFDAIPDEVLMAAAVAYDKEHPYQGASSAII